MARSPESPEPETRERRLPFYVITLAWAAGMIYLTVYATGQWETPFDWGVTVGQAIISLQIVWLAASFKVVPVDEIGIVLSYGLPMVKVSRGPKLVIFGIFQLERFPAEVMNDQFPADPEFIQKTPDEVPLETVTVTLSDGSIVTRQKVRPIRITTSKAKEHLGEKDLLNVQMTVEFTFWVRWQINDPAEFILKVGGSIEGAKKHMRDTGESLLNNEVTQRTPSELISEFFRLQEKLSDEIKLKMKGWGIEIEEVGLTAPDINHQVAASLRNVPIAKSDAEQVVIAAAAERKRLEEEGAGRGKAREEELAGEGRGYQRLGKSIKIDPAAALQAQVARDTIGEGDVILGADGITQLFGLGKKIVSDSKPKNSESEGE